MNNRKGFLYLLITGIIYASFGIWIRILNTELSVYQQIFLRSAVGLLFAIIIALLLKQRFVLNGVNKIFLLIYSLVFPIAIIFYVEAMLKTKISSATFSFYASSLFASLLYGFVIFKEKISVQKIVGLILSLLGLGIIAFPFSREVLNLGFGFALLSGFFDSTTNVFRRFFGGKIDRFVLVAIQMLGSMLFLLVLVLISGQKIIPSMSFPILATVILLGFLLMLVVFLMISGFQNFDLNLGTIILSSEIIFAPIYAAIIFREFPSTNELVGGVFIALSIIVANYSLFKKKQRK